MDENKRKLLEQRVELIPLTEVNDWRKPGMLVGFELPLPGDNSAIVFNMVQATSGATMGLYRKQLNAKYASVQGHWQFVPDLSTLHTWDGPVER